jgi:hypothetical protein
MAGRRLISGAALLALVLAGYSAPSPYAQWKDLGAVYCNQVPLPRDAKFRDAEGGGRHERSQNEPESMAYRFDTQESPERLVAFYEKAFPTAVKEVGSDGATTFRVTPDGAQEGEQVSITVHADGRIQIGEQTKAGRHQDTGTL